MKTQQTRRFALCLSALLLNGWFVAQAQPNPDNPDRPRPPRAQRAQPNPPEGRFQPGPGLALMERVLTDDQRESMRSIMASQREAMRDIQDKMREARKELLKASLADKFDEEDVRAKALAVAKLEAEITVLRAKALSQVQPPLSDEQVEQIMSAPQERMQPGEPRRGERPQRPREGAGPGRPRRPDSQ
ncbi:MAG TPA: Spy/CpxP family protein refolding chaperone [Verrucomicrobiae bacterium]|nr:Spy/CpxP family protein refolding chaperone [Verrucomicrobiae bacterium]